MTCIQFNPLDDNYFISGSLDAKIRLWNVAVRQVVDWTDLHEMVTAASFTPDGQVQLHMHCFCPEPYFFRVWRIFEHAYNFLRALSSN